MSDHTDDRRANLRFQVNELRRQYSNFGFQLEPGDKKLDSGQFVEAIMQLFDTECAERERLARIDEIRQITAITGKYASKMECFNKIEPHTRKRLDTLKSGAAGKEAGQ